MSKPVDYTGFVFGQLTALRPIDKRNQGAIVWECQCSCGKLAYVSTKHMGVIKSCGCLTRNDLTGRRFGRLIAIKPTDRRSSNRGIVWLTRCDCGNFHYATSDNLISGHVKSCGCLKLDDAKKRKTSMAGHLNHAWKADKTDEERQQGRLIPGYKEWRLEVYKRDDFTCQRCGDSTGGNLNAHHIDGYADNPKLRTSLNNGVTLCKDCHRNYHHIYGINATRKTFEEWMNEE